MICPLVVAVALEAVGTCVAVTVPVPVGLSESPVGTLSDVIDGPVFPNNDVMPTFEVPNALVNSTFTTPGTPVVTTCMSSRSPAAALKLWVVSEHDVADAPEIVQVSVWLDPPSRQVKTAEFPVPRAAET